MMFLMWRSFDQMVNSDLSVKAAPVDTLWVKAQGTLAGQESAPATQDSPENAMAKGSPAGSGKTSSGADNTAREILQLKKELTNLKTRQELTLIRQNTLTDDIRQETNNYINKANGWISFWIGIIALLGVILPLMLQYKLYRVEKDRLDKLVEFKEKEWETLRKQMDATLGKMEEEVAKAKLHNLSRIMELTHDHKLIRNHTEALLTPAERKFWQDVLFQFRALVKRCFKDGELEISKRQDLLQALIIIYGITRTYVSRPELERKRDYDKAIDTLRNQIANLTSNRNISSPLLYQEMIDLRTLLASLF